MIPIYVYYHIAQMGNWKEVISEQITKLGESGLQDEAIAIRVGVVGTQELKLDLPEKFEILFHKSDLKMGEIPTMEALHQHASTEDFLVLYMHTKGVSYQEQDHKRENMAAWRRYLEHFCIGRWRECVTLLETHDASGCELVGPLKMRTHNSIVPQHFSGNFWWSKSSYLRKLPPVNDVANPFKKPGRLCPDRWHGHRMKAEFWIGSIPEFNPVSLFNLNLKLYKHLTSPEQYGDSTQLNL